MAKEWARPLYNSRAWKRVREFILRRDNYMCQCYRLTGAAEPCGDPAEEVHHIERLTAQNVNDPAIALNADNLIAMSRDHHLREHEKERVHRSPDCNDNLMFNEDGMLVEVSREQR